MKFLVNHSEIYGYVFNWVDFLFFILKHGRIDTESHLVNIVWSGKAWDQLSYRNSRWYLYHWVMLMLRNIHSHKISTAPILLIRYKSPFYTSGPWQQNISQTIPWHRSNGQTAFPKGSLNVIFLLWWIGEFNFADAHYSWQLVLFLKKVLDIFKLLLLLWLATLFTLQI